MPVKNMFIIRLTIPEASAAFDNILLIGSANMSLLMLSLDSSPRKPFCTPLAIFVSRSSFSSLLCSALGVRFNPSLSASAIDNLSRAFSSFMAYLSAMNCAFFSVMPSKLDSIRFSMIGDSTPSKSSAISCSSAIWFSVRFSTGERTTSSIMSRGSIGLYTGGSICILLSGLATPLPPSSFSSSSSCCCCRCNSLLRFISSLWATLTCVIISVFRSNSSPQYGHEKDM